MGNAEKLIDVIDGVNIRVTNLAASTEEIAASADMISSISSDLRGKLRKLESGNETERTINKMKRLHIGKDVTDMEPFFISQF